MNPSQIFGTPKFYHLLYNFLWINSCHKPQDTHLIPGARLGEALNPLGLPRSSTTNSGEGEILQLFGLTPPPPGDSLEPGDRVVPMTALGRREEQIATTTRARPWTALSTSLHTTPWSKLLSTTFWAAGMNLFFTWEDDLEVSWSMKKHIKFDK